MRQTNRRLHWLSILAILLCALCRLEATDRDLSCNGSPEFCDLRFNQVTLPGSHSAGSGYNGPLHTCTGEESNSCVFRNQDTSITSQLNFGIRYLSLDICYLPQNCDEMFYPGMDASRLVSCQGSNTDSAFEGGYSYGGSLAEILGQVDDWMRDNPREVIGIHFTRNTQGNRALVFDSLVSLLEAMWGAANSTTANATTPSSSSAGAGGMLTEMSTYYFTNSRSWPTLAEAIESNQRIFVFVDSELNPNGIHRDWKNPTPTSVVPTGWVQLCNHDTFCDVATPSELVIVTGYTLAICISTGQRQCNIHLPNVTDTCYESLEATNRTVNVILVNYPESNMNPNTTVVQLALELNERNVDRFVVSIDMTTSTVEMPSSNSTSTSGAVSPTMLSTSSTASVLFSSAVLSYTFLSSLLLSV